MSVSQAATELRQALARLPFGLLIQAATRFDEARTILGAASQGTSRPEAGAALQALTQAISDVADLHGTASQAKELIEQYIARIAGGGQAGTAQATTPMTPWAPRPATRAGPRSDVDQELVATLVRQGTKITPEKVVRIGRDKAGKVVWLEQGDEHAGLAHLHGDKRVAEFDRSGIAREEIVDLVFIALTRGRLIGLSGKDRPVYEVEYRDRTRRVAVSVGSNGFIVGANPINATRKVKPLP